MAEVQLVKDNKTWEKRSNVWSARTEMVKGKLRGAGGGNTECQMLRLVVSTLWI